MTFFDEPIITLLSALLEHIEKQKSKVKKGFEDLKEAIISVMGAFAIIGNQVLATKVGINIQELTKQSNEQSKDRDICLGNKIFQEYSEKKKLFDSLNEALENYIDSLKENPDSNKIEKPLFILIDELDRARPDYAVKFIETLKHFFQTQGVIFILAVDKIHLEASVKALYGSGINFPEYYRKFIHRNVSFPEINEGSVENYTKKRIKEHFTDKTERYFVKHDLNWQQICQLCLAFNLSPRQMDEFFRILSHFFSTQEQRRQGSYDWALPTIFYIVISLYDEIIC